MSHIAILATHLGFAGALGELIYRARTRPEDAYLVSALSFSGVIFLPSSLSLPFEPRLRSAVWLAAITITLVFSLRPARLPAWLWSAPFAFRYLSLVMLLILGWSFQAGLSSPMIYLGAPASMAAWMAYRRSARWRAKEVQAARPA